jgi:hypothetical protein
MTQTLTHHFWCDRSVHEVSADPDRGRTEPCLSSTVEDGDAFAYLDGGTNNAKPLLVVVIPPSHGGFTAESYALWRAAIDALAAQLRTGEPEGENPTS